MVAALALLAPPSWADARSGLVAFRSGRIAEALDSWEDGAAAGDATSLLYLASAYDTGAGVPQDFAQALELYRESAEHGSVAAALDVALMYDSGRGTPRSPSTAALWYRRAAKLGSGRAAYNLGLLLQNGDGVARDRAGAIAAYRRALALGIPAAAQKLASLGVAPQASRPQPPPPPAPQADELADAQRSLRQDGLSPDAVAGLSERASKGDGLAAFDLAYAYENGLGVQTDKALALLWYGEASKARGRVGQFAQQSYARLKAAADTAR